MWKDHSDNIANSSVTAKRNYKILIDGDYALTFHLPSYSYYIWTE